jgi:acyl-CoA synthetase (AMP-forming)/AMP-acid ligase II
MWTHGGCVVYASEVFDPVATVRAIAEERATALHGVPTMFLNMLKVVDAVRAGVDPSLADIRLDFSTLRTGIAAGSPVPSPLMSLLTSPDSLNLRDLTIVFGQTESSPGCVSCTPSIKFRLTLGTHRTFMSRTDDPLQKRIDTVGRVLPHTQAKVTDPADPMRILPLGETGELQVSGYPVFEGYWANEAETAKVLLRDEEGKTWLRTGDLAALDDDGTWTCWPPYRSVNVLRLPDHQRPPQGPHHPRR